MVFYSAAEDLKTLLAAHFNPTQSDALTDNPGFDTPAGTDNWTVVNAETNNTIPQAGTECLHLDTLNGYCETDAFSVSVSLVTAATFYLRFPTGSTNADVEMTITYSDSDTTVVTYSFASADTWVQKDYLSNLVPGKIITKITWKLITAQENGAFVDTFAFTFTSTSMGSIRLLDDDPPDPYPDNGEIIIGKERLVNSSYMNFNFRSERYLVEVKLLYGDVETTSTTLKAKAQILDDILQGENKTIDRDYIFTILYEWPGGFRIGLMRLMIEMFREIVSI